MCWLRCGRNPYEKARKVALVNRVEHFHDSTLDDLVFQRCYAERPLPPVRLGNERNAQAEVCVVRYADDTVVGFQKRRGRYMVSS